MTQLTKNPSFESINVGDELPPFEIGETHQSLAEKMEENKNLPQHGEPSKMLPRSGQTQEL